MSEFVYHLLCAIFGAIGWGIVTLLQETSISLSLVYWFLKFLLVVAIGIIILSTIGIIILSMFANLSQSSSVRVFRKR